MGAAGSVPVVPAAADEKEVHEALLNKFEALKLKDEAAELPEALPGTLKECLEVPPPGDDANEATQKAYATLAEVLEERLEEFQTPEIKTALKALPDALDSMVYQYERWPILLDPSGQGSRFMRYQRGQFLLAQNPADMSKENLRKTLVGALQHGACFMVNFDDMEKVDLEEHFDEEHFPRQVLRKIELFQEEVWKRLLRPKQGDPEPEVFQLKDDFKLVLMTANETAGRAFAAEHGLGVISVLDPNDPGARKGPGRRGQDAGSEEIAAAFGARDVHRNSIKLVEAAFDGEWDVIQEEMDRGYSFESEDVHQHTALSEAACQGHMDICTKLMDLGADPNAQNDAGRSPLYRASYNGHLETVQLLLSRGADPRLAAGMETPYDVAKTDEVREVLESWDIAETEKLVAARAAEAEKLLESRLTTAAERDAYARDKIRQELVDLAMEGKTRELQDRLQELADEAQEHNERPRGTAEARDARGMTLLLIAASNGNAELLEMLLSQYKTFDPEFDKVERKTFFANIKAREAKGWNACALAVFHGHKKILQRLLDEGCDPYVKNAYNKNAFDLAQDDKDAARKVTVDRSEIRSVLLDWEKLQNPRAAALREKEAKEAAEKPEGDAEKEGKKKEGAKDAKKKGKAAGAAPGAKKGAAKKKKNK
ncbi:Ankyrin repeat and KH domain-containing protein 1 [Hondaea fermentalgiana]|uniref:Ankyrin repeat and KH domain-containing protein 1 n=1 Tax=Hondaea fermentalgiana TaxID=2315210 RepID=A0A2R5GXT2_9STRA|nr:Ankyrin repeat and KH domain-containing protein 1 [Hondaea fermentalgiana]|eukprot:GBG34598.1 Ankyrin repeat and KH domain-containing protein 1 [Hondaea fermentalgiana]